ncbi:MAG: PaaI family thioesterase [Pseudomonadota bacterium]
MTEGLTPADLGISGYEGSFLAFLDFRIIAHERDFVRLRMPLRQEHTNTMNMAHGGVVMSMLDIAGAFAAHVAEPRGTKSVTMTQSTQFLRAVTGDALLAEGRVVRRSKSIVFTESRILDPSESDGEAQLCATAQCSFKLRYPEPK